MNLDTVEGILEQVKDISEVNGRDQRQWLYREILLNALKCKRDELDILDLKVINRMVDEFRYAAKVFKPYRSVRKVSIFGSARVPEGDPHYELAARFAHQMTGHGFMAITGAASGIMKAGIDGAGPENSFGVSILLPFESPSVVMGDDPKLVAFRFFFTRKIFFVMEADACALFPGGFGTQDEGFEVLTLLQTGKAQPMPLVLMELPGDNYWETWDRFVRDQLLDRGYISEEDLSLYKIVHSAEAAAAWIQFYYSTYHSVRQVHDKLVVRLEKQLTEDHLRRLNESFSDLVESGTIAATGPLSQERDDPGLMLKPRIAFRNNKRSAGRLNQLIVAINLMGNEVEAGQPDTAA
ncbi:MAG: LOG family protein [Chloroflexi bacterium]|nr:LOG family protein [Chloroflexota bacterium]MDA1272340.1 LOG family protein [Chloroflexota bacterium]